MFEVREKPRMVEKAYLVGVEHPDMPAGEAQCLLEELEELVETLGIPVIHKEKVRLAEPKPRFLLGSGRAVQIMEHAKELGCDVIVFDDALSPAQQRNWEQESGVCVIDRQEVILDIFADRAQTREAVLQVALARMEYSLPRLKRAWTHLSRQRGGGTNMRGQGETQLEADSRLVRDRIARLKRQLREVEKQRGTQRKQRMRVPLPTVSIVGYTNAGKSTLLNALTGASALSEDKLFATLDPTTRQMPLPRGEKVLLTDTVGFVRRLPHNLVEAFKATLEEAVLADVLIHVIDATSPEMERHYQTTNQVLEELGAGGKNTITILNKIDRLESALDRQVLRYRFPEAIAVSALTGEGLDQLREEVAARVAVKRKEPRRLLIPWERSDLLAQLHKLGCVLEEKPEDDGTRILAEIPERHLHLYKPLFS